MGCLRFGGMGLKERRYINSPTLTSVGEPDLQPDLFPKGQAVNGARKTTEEAPKSPLGAVMELWKCIVDHLTPIIAKLEYEIERGRPRKRVLKMICDELVLTETAILAKLDKIEEELLR